MRHTQRRADRCRHSTRLPRRRRGRDRDDEKMSCDMATPHEMKTWRRSRSPLKDTAIRPFERTVDLTKATPPTRNFTMLREMKQRLKDLEGKRSDVSAQINDADISALKSEIEALEKELVAEAEEDSPDEDEDVPP